MTSVSGAPKREKNTITLDELKALAPWHYDIRINAFLKTSHANCDEHAGRPCINPHELMGVIRTIYPEGLEERSFVDVACNGGAYCLLARDFGAKEVFGFDVRESWIEQANFLKHRLHGNKENIHFAVCDLMELNHFLPKEKAFDVCLFKGIFYHLPDPVTGLKIIADRTREVIIVDSDTAPGHPDGLMKFIFEGTDNPLSGVHRMAWLPTGPDVIANILKWLGFTTTKTLFWWQPGEDASPFTRGRVRVVAARKPEFLQHIMNDEMATDMHIS
jgi:SAM-dependent methyltransferase